MDSMTLSIAGGTFTALRTDIDAAIQGIIGNMHAKQTDHGEVTIKLSVDLERVAIPCDDAQRSIIKPQFDHKVTSQMRIKSETAGTVAGNYELLWDEERQEFVMVEIRSGQTTIFEDDQADGPSGYKSGNCGDEDGDDGQALLSGGQFLLVEGGVDLPETYGTEEDDGGDDL